MAFAISNTNATQSTLNQTGTDTSWSGIETAVNALPIVARNTAYAVGAIVKPTVANGYLYRCTTAGTSGASEPQFGTTAGSATTDGTAVFFAFFAPKITIEGDGRIYECATYDVVINGTLTIANPMIQTIVCRRWTTATTAIYTSGSFMTDGFTPKFDGVHFKTVMKGANDFQEVSTWAGTWNIRGGRIQIAASVKPDGDLPMIFTTVTFTSSALWSRSIRFRAFATQLRFLRECRLYNIAFDAFRIPPEINAKGFASEYLLEYVGSSAGGTDSKMVVTALSVQDSTSFDFDNYGGGWVEIYDCLRGDNLNIVNLNNDARHCLPLFQNLNIKIINLANIAQNDVKFRCIDVPTNSPTALITTAGGLKTWDYRNPITYTGITAGTGIATSQPVSKVHHGSTNIKNRRFPVFLDTDGITKAIATYRFCGYKVIQQDVTVILAADKPIDVPVSMTAATNLILTQSQAAALTGISLVASGATGGTVTATVACTLSEAWQYFRAWKPDNLSSDDSWTFDGAKLNVSLWTVLGLEFLTGGELIVSTATANAAFNNIKVTGNVIQNIPTSLTGITATSLTYNAPNDTTIILTNCTIGTIKNDGVGIIEILKVGTTTITDYSDPQINFLDSSLSFVGIASLTAYPTATDRDSNTNAGFTKNTSPFNFKFGSVVSGITMSGTIYLRLTIGTTVQLSETTIALGTNVLSLTDNSLLQGIGANLQKVNRNLIKESLITPEFMKEKF